LANRQNASLDAFESKCKQYASYQIFLNSWSFLSILAFTLIAAIKEICTMADQFNLPKTIVDRANNLMDQVKYLEVILDKKLEWKAHLENRMRKACIACRQCRCAVGKTCGLSPKVVAWL
jgi:hypothetical protein